MKKIVILLVTAVIISSCVSKKDYVSLEQKYNDTRSTLQKTTLEKEGLEAKFAKIEDRVANYYKKIRSIS